MFSQTENEVKFQFNLETSTGPYLFILNFSLISCEEIGKASKQVPSDFAVLKLTIFLTTALSTGQLPYFFQIIIVLTTRLRP